MSKIGIKKQISPKPWNNVTMMISITSTLGLKRDTKIQLIEKINIPKQAVSREPNRLISIRIIGTDNAAHIPRGNAIKPATSTE